MKRRGLEEKGEGCLDKAALSSEIRRRNSWATTGIRCPRHKKQQRSQSEAGRHRSEDAGLEDHGQE